MDLPEYVRQSCSLCCLLTKCVTSIADYRIHPAVLDASLHILVHPVVTGVNDAARYYLPSRIGSLIVHDALLDRPFPPIVYTHAVFKAWTPGMVMSLVSTA